MSLGERPLLGILAKTPAELRMLRRGIVSAAVGGVATSLALTLLLPKIIERIPSKFKTQALERPIIKTIIYRPTLILKEPLLKALLRR